MENITRISQVAGTFLHMDIMGLDNPSLRRFIRVRLFINILLSLKRGFKLLRGDGENQLRIPFRYEKLPEFCYKCGRIRHEKNTCLYILDDLEIEMYGLWLKPIINGGSKKVSLEKLNSGELSGRLATEISS